MKLTDEQIECENCGWEGERQDAILTNKQHSKVWWCPDCGKLIEIEEIEETVKWRSAT